MQPIEGIIGQANVFFVERPLISELGSRPAKLARTVSAGCKQFNACVTCAAEKTSQ